MGSPHTLVLSRPPKPLFQIRTNLSRFLPSLLATTHLSSFLSRVFINHRSSFHTSSSTPYVEGRTGPEKSRVVDGENHHAPHFTPSERGGLCTTDSTNGCLAHESRTVVERYSQRHQSCQQTSTEQCTSNHQIPCGDSSGNSCRLVACGLHHTKSACVATVAG